jgi:hypothetical protein
MSRRYLRGFDSPACESPAYRRADVARRLGRDQPSDEFEAGAVLNLSEADVDSLSAEGRGRYRETIDAFPALTGRGVYVGVGGVVTERDGRLVLGPDAKLRVGETRYSISSAAKRLGMSEAELRDAIENDLSQLAGELPNE